MVNKSKILIAGIITASVVILFTIYRKMRGNYIEGIALGVTPQDKNVKAFLMAIRKSEGTDSPDGYRMLFGGGLFDGYDKHPNKLITLSGYSSTAAGAYQILYKTWLYCKTLVGGLDNFSPENQDKAAIALIDHRGALADVMAGRTEAAIKKCNREWASLPGSPYGQPKVTVTQFNSWFMLAGGELA